MRAIASTPRSATSRRRISASTISFSTLRRPSKSSRASRSSYGALADLARVLRPLHQLAHETVGVELPQRAVEVVGAADRPARFHPREPAHRRGRELAQLLTVHAHERVEQHARELLVAHVAHRAAAVAGRAELLAVAVRSPSEPSPASDSASTPRLKSEK